MKQKENYNNTLIACFIGYIVQAIVNNFVPLLFLRFQGEFDISLEKITLLVTFNFGVQLLVDLLSANYVNKIGYRSSILLAHVCAAAGLIGLTIFPTIMGDSFLGLLIAVGIYAIGGGLIEVLVSPIVEACPTKRKEAAMSLLHSFYCWGHVGVVLLSTIFFTLAGISNWRVLACLWAVIPLMNIALFAVVPIAPLVEEGEEELSVGMLFRNKVFLLMLVLMMCAGASEQAVSQWASAFAEAGLGVSKTIGDLAGPLAFAMLMGTSRLLYGKYSEHFKLERLMTASTVLCIVGYLITSLSVIPVLGFVGCAICGFSVGIMWPGTFSLSAKAIKGGGTAMFAFLALAGDLGCGSGPTFVGMVSGALGQNLKMGILAAVLFPIVLMIGLKRYRRLTQ